METVTARWVLNQLDARAHRQLRMREPLPSPKPSPFFPAHVSSQLLVGDLGSAGYDAKLKVYKGEAGHRLILLVGVCPAPPP